MTRLALAALAVVLAARAAHAAPHAPPKPAHAAQPARAAQLVRAVIVSGDGQSAHAYVTPGRKRYQTEIPSALVVRVPAPAPRKGDRRVHFTCITSGCTFAPTDQPDDGVYVERVDGVDNAYVAKIHKGVAAVRVTIESPAATRAYTVRADPVVQRGERAQPVSFTLTAR